MMRRILVGCAAVLAMAACGDDGPTEPKPIPSGSFSLSLPPLNGQAAGTFRANGVIELDGKGGFVLGNWAAGAFGVESTAPIYVHASAPAGGGLFNYVNMTVPRAVQAGAVVPIRNPCRPVDGDCATFTLGMNLESPDLFAGGAPRIFCSLVGTGTGSVRIATRGGGRMTGTVPVDVLCESFPVAETRFRYTVTDGVFDVPVGEASDYVRDGS